MTAVPGLSLSLQLQSIQKSASAHLSSRYRCLSKRRDRERPGAPTTLRKDAFQRLASLLPSLPTTPRSLFSPTLSPILEMLRSSRLSAAAVRSSPSSLAAPSLRKRLSPTMSSSPKASSSRLLARAYATSQSAPFTPPVDSSVFSRCYSLHPLETDLCLLVASLSRSQPPLLQYLRPPRYPPVPPHRTR